MALRRIIAPLVEEMKDEINMTGSRIRLFIVVALLIPISLAQPAQGADPAPRVLQELNILPESASIEESGTQPYVAIGTYSNGVRRDVTSEAKWSSSNRKLSATTADGTAAGIKSGKVTITAAIGTLKATGKLTIEPRLMSIIVPPPETILVPGEGYAFIALGRYSDGTVRRLTDRTGWSVDDKRVATIDATGIAMAIRKGTVTIVAAVRDLRATTQLRISDAVKQAEALLPISVTPRAAIAPSAATITATLNTVHTAASVSVAPVIQSIAIQPQAAILTVGQTQQVTATATMSDG
ncbi:MAG TPA: Ig-like domain-containing protein, partial [Thermoanaerobaculia bacterium]|nr:Ig-like domain-containing protein [Thermoanaerobaculia bacterium]